jgi:hypothetical protein
MNRRGGVTRESPVGEGLCLEDILAGETMPCFHIIASHPVTSCHIAPHDNPITSSRHTTPRHVTSHHIITSHHTHTHTHTHVSLVSSHHITSHRTSHKSRLIVSCHHITHNISHRITSYQLRHMTCVCARARVRT